MDKFLRITSTFLQAGLIIIGMGIIVRIAWFLFVLGWGVLPQ